MLAKFGLPFEKATPLVHFQRTLKPPRNNEGPASLIYNFIRVCVSVCVKAKCVNISARIAIKFRTRTKNLAGMGLTL